MINSFIKNTIVVLLLLSILLVINTDIIYAYSFENRGNDKLYTKSNSVGIEENNFANLMSIYEQEPNNTINSANKIYLNSTVIGTINDGTKDIDWYVITLPQDGELSLEVSSDKVFEKDSTLSVGVYYNNLQSQVMSLTSHGNNNIVEKKVILSKGTYYINVGASVLDYANYTIKPSLKLGNYENYEKEYNGTTETSNSINLNTTYIGSIDHPNGSDLDYYKFIVPKTGIVSINANHAKISKQSIPKLFLSLKGFTNSQLYNYGYFQTYENNPNVTFNQGLSPGTYYIEIDANTSDRLDYKFSVTFKEQDDYETEFNNSISTSNKIKFAKYYTGRLFDADDIDFYSFSLNNTSTIQLNFDHSIIGNTKDAYWEVMILDSNYKNYFTFYSYGGETKLSKTIKLNKGTYSIKVSRWNYTDSEYKLSVVNTNSDWQLNWAKNEIRYSMDKGWVVKTDIFRPNDAITRAEFIKIVNKAVGFTQKAPSENYTDVKSNDWWYNEVLIAIKAGYIDTKSSKFRPTDSISRQEVAAIITSIKKNKDITLDKIKNYTDFNQISSWAQSSVEGAIEAGYMGKGSTSFRPLSNITRAEAVVTLYRITTKP